MLASTDYLAVISLLASIQFPNSDAVIFWPTSAGNRTIFSPIYTKKHPKELGGLHNIFRPSWRKLCNEKTFGLHGMKVPVCQTVFTYGFSRPPIVTYGLGRLKPEVTTALRKQYGSFLKPRVLHDGHRERHDGDMCCPTIRSLREAPHRMRDSHGNHQDIIHIPDEGLYQYYHAGNCLDSRENVYCHGTCVEETSSVYLAVFDFESDYGFTFQAFDVPTYCSCKNISFNERRERNGRANQTATEPPPRDRFNKNDTAPDLFK